MKSRWTAVATVAAFGAIVACSSSAQTGGGQYGSCTQSLLGSSCISCLQSNCGGAVSDFEASCGDYLDCICPGGDFSAANAQSATCGSRLAESACESSVGDGGAVACGACATACSSFGASSNGDSFGTSGGSSGGSSGASSDCASANLPGSMAVTLSLAGANFGSPAYGDWRTSGFDLDGKCTTNSSTDTCALASGAPLNNQDDGANGIDNSFGENLCPILSPFAKPDFCSETSAAEGPPAYLQTDASGNGTLVLAIGSSTRSVLMAYPLRDVRIRLSGSGGMVGGVIPTAGLTAAWQEEAGCIDTALCSASALQELTTTLEQTSDIAADGSNTAGTPCDGVSFGLSFTGSTPVTSLPSLPSCSCP